MKVQIRQGVFETNSSSTHAVSVCTKQQWDDYKAGKLWMNIGLQLLPAEDAQEHNNDRIASAKARYERHGYKKFRMGKFEEYAERATDKLLELL